MAREVSILQHRFTDMIVLVLCTGDCAEQKRQGLAGRKTAANPCVDILQHPPMSCVVVADTYEHIK